MGPQTLEFRDSHLGVSGQNVIWMWALLMELMLVVAWDLPLDLDLAQHKVCALKQIHMCFGMYKKCTKC